MATPDDSGHVMVGPAPRCRLVRARRALRRDRAPLRGAWACSAVIVRGRDGVAAGPGRERPQPASSARALRVATTVAAPSWSSARWPSCAPGTGTSPSPRPWPWRWWACAPDPAPLEHPASPASPGAIAVALVVGGAGLGARHAGSHGRGHRRRRPGGRQAAPCGPRPARCWPLPCSTRCSGDRRGTATAPHAGAAPGRRLRARPAHLAWAAAVVGSGSGCGSLQLGRLLDRPRRTRSADPASSTPRALSPPSCTASSPAHARCGRARACADTCGAADAAGRRRGGPVARPRRPLRARRCVGPQLGPVAGASRRAGDGRPDRGVRRLGHSVVRPQLPSCATLPSFASPTYALSHEFVEATTNPFGQGGIADRPAAVGGALLPLPWPDVVAGRRPPPSRARWPTCASPASPTPPERRRRHARGATASSVARLLPPRTGLRVLSEAPIPGTTASVVVGWIRWHRPLRPPRPRFGAWPPTSAATIRSRSGVPMVLPPSALWVMARRVDHAAAPLRRPRVRHVRPRRPAAPLLHHLPLEYPAPALAVFLLPSLLPLSYPWAFAVLVGGACSWPW